MRVTTQLDRTLAPRPPLPLLSLYINMFFFSQMYISDDGMERWVASNLFAVCIMFVSYINRDRYTYTPAGSTVTTQVY